MPVSDRPTRRQFLEVAAGGLGLAGAGSTVDVLARQRGEPPSPSSGTGGDNLLTNPRYQVGATYRPYHVLLPDLTSDPQDDPTVKSSFTEKQVSVS